jgi:hypothetical protein
MNDRARALEILREARDLVAQRLTERILESAEELLDDARGDSYMGEIDSLYEQVGMRMVHLSQMISHLPTEIDPAPHSNPASTSSFFTATTEANPGHDTFVADTMPALMGPVYISMPALPAPTVQEEDAARNSSITFQTFVAQIYAGELKIAGKSLASLFGVSEGRGQRCAAHFAERMNRDTQFLHRAMQLRAELQVGDEQSALILLHQCFGLAGLDAITVLSYLRRRMFS